MTASKRDKGDGHNKVIWFETAATCCCYHGGEGAPPTNEHTPNDKETTIVYCRSGAKMLPALRRVKPDGYGAPLCFQTVKT